MKRCFFIFLLILCLLPGLAGAEEEDALYPIRENGLWGYMNRTGETVIAPQWEYAGLFSDGIAVVGSDQEDWELIGGLIRKDGEMLLPMEYSITETTGGFIFSLWDESADSYQNQWFYDKASGALFPISYDYIMDWYGGELLIAENDGLYGFICRDTGEVVFPLQFDGLYGDVGCREGHVLAAYERGYQGDGSVWGPDYHLYALTGEEIVFPFGIKPDSCVHDGVLRIARELTKEEQKSHPSGWGIVYGLGKPDGSVVVEPKYDHLEFAGEGLVSTYLDGKCGVIDLTGREIVPPQYQISTGGKLPMIVYWNGYTEIDDAQAGKSLILDEKGEEIYSIPRQSMISGTDDTRYYTLTSPYKNGCFWVHSWTVNRENDMIRQENTNYQLMKIVDGQAISLNDEYYSDITPWIEAACDQTEENFAEGLQAVCQNSLWGFIDENGLPSLPFQWNAACNFHNGLALVEKDGKLAYIDHNGTVIWREP